MSMVETIPGAVYAVEAQGAIQVINPAGVVVYEGENALSFPAVHASYEITPDSAAVRQVFKLAPRTKLHLLMGGAGGWLPRGFTELEYLETSGSQKIDTARNVLGETGVKVEYQETFSANYLQEAVGTRGSGFFWFVPRRSSSNPAVQDFFYYTSSTAGLKNWGRVTAEMNYKNSGLLFLKNTIGNTYERVLPAKADVVLPSLKICGTSNPFVGRIWYCEVSEGQEIVSKFVPVLDASGTPCMYDKVSKQCFYNSGTGSFIAGLTMKQIPALRRLPTVTSGELTLSLPWEAQLVKHRAPAILESVKNRGWTLIVQYAEPDTESAVYNKYAECKTVADIAAVNPDYKNDLTVEKEWVYPLSNLERTGLGFQDHNSFFYYAAASKVNFYAPKTKDLYYLFFSARITKVHIYAPNATNGQACLRWCSLLEEVTGDLSSLQNGNSLLGRCYKIRSWSIPTPQLTNGTEMFFANRMLEDVQTEFPALEKGPNMFTETILNKESVIRVANSLPTWTSGTHEICFGIHVDHQNDEEVLAALEAVEAKGWTLTVQWNGTATAAAAATYGLRRPPVYAKPGTIEHPDGTTEQMLNWGHYVTDWAENGYTEFASREEAYAHFNLTMPE